MSDEDIDRVDHGRRKLLRALAASGPSVATGIVSGIASAVATQVYFSLYGPDSDQNADKAMFDFLIGEDFGPPSIFAGEGNPLARAEGLKDLSVYLDYSSRQFSNFVASSLGIDVVKSETNYDGVFRYTPDRSAIFLGSPSANYVTSHLLGYKSVEVAHGDEVVRMYSPDSGNNITRWNQIYGESGYGVYSGKLETAARYSSRTGDLVSRPIYKLLDKFTGKLISPKVSSGFLMEEWLTIVRLIDRGSPKVVIGGMHGYSTEAFAKNISENIGHLESIVGSAEQFQVVVPIELTHEADLVHQVRTTGRIDWSRALSHLIK